MNRKLEQNFSFAMIYVYSIYTYVYINFITLKVIKKTFQTKFSNFKNLKLSVYLQN